MSEEKEIFLKHLQKAGLKRTGQRDLILEVFLGTEEHVSSERLYDLVREKDPHVGYTTVYRTLKLLTDCGLAREVRFGDGRAHYEHNYKHEHHDHLICTACGQIVEFFSPEMEALQDDIAASHGFVVTQHSMRLFGLCAECRKKSQLQNLASAAQPRVRPAVARAS
jgi:Fur family ferric uptake transcriptional regulator